MTIQYFHKNSIRHKVNSERLQCSGNSEKPENNTKIKFLKFQDNYNKPTPPQGLEQYYKVTPCNEKCNFFILLKRITLLRILPIGIIPLCRVGTFLLFQFLNLLFCGRGFRSPILHFFCRRGMPKCHSYR